MPPKSRRTLSVPELKIEDCDDDCDVPNSHRVVEEVKQVIGIGIKDRPQSLSFPVEPISTQRSARSAKKEDYQGSNSVHPIERIYTDEELPNKLTEPSEMAFSYLNFDQY